MCFPSFLLLFPHICLGWISRACFVRVFLFHLLFLYYSMGAAQLMGCSSGDRSPAIAAAFGSGERRQALPPPPLSSSFTSAVFNNVRS